MSDRAAAAERAITFGPFRLLPSQRLLLEGEKVHRLGSRALDILIALVERPGELASKDHLLARVWPNSRVEESNLKVHVAALRRALGDGGGGNRFVVTVPGRGYSFIAPVAVEERQTPRRPVDPAQPSHNLPTLLTRLIGRSAVVANLTRQMAQQRLITVVGPGGIGKTSVALAVAEALISSYDDGVRWVDLATVSDPVLAPSALAALLGLTVLSDDPLPALVNLLRDRQMLVVLDNCGHVIEAAATLADGILRGAPGVRILATSRQPLRVEGEHVRRLPVLATPPPSASSAVHLTAEEALRFPAVELFVERARAVQDDFVLSDDDAQVVGDLCRNLDGIPLAIEFAAGRVYALSVRSIATWVDDNLRLLAGGRRTALPRHRTLQAMLDWSHDLLPEPERVVLRRVAIFSGAFTLEAARGVGAGDGIVGRNVIDLIASLVEKSLLTTDISGPEPHFRLLRTVRAYALDKLAESGETGRLTRRHAEYHADLFGHARGLWEGQATAAWLAEYGYRLDDLRAALDWAFAPNGDTALGMALTVDAVPLWLQHSLMGECRRRVEQALSHIGAETSENERLRMRLWTALSLSRMYAGDKLSDIDAAWSATLDLAERVGDRDYQLRAIWGLFAGSFNRGNLRAALNYAEQFSRVATTEAGRLIGERLLGTALHVLGFQQNARRHIEHMLANYRAPVTSSHIIRFQNDQVIAAQRVLGPILWLQGYPDQAMAMVEDAVSAGLRLDHALSLCNLLAQAACPVAFLTGDLSAARRFTAMLIEQATRHSLDVWNTHGRCFEGLLLTREGDFQAGLVRLRAAGQEFRQAGFFQYYTPYLGHLAETLAAAGQFAPALAAIDEARARAAASEEHWCLAELLRMNGELLLLRNADEDCAAAAEDCFNEALKVAREQGVLSWELRAAVSLGRLRITQGRRDEAKRIVADVHGRFTEGHATEDLRAAKALLDTIP